MTKMKGKGKRMKPRNKYGFLGDWLVTNMTEDIGW